MLDRALMPAIIAIGVTFAASSLSANLQRNLKEVECALRGPGVVCIVDDQEVIDRPVLLATVVKG